MPSYVYKGISAKEKVAMIEARCKILKPQDKRGENRIYGINSNDSEAVKEEKRKNVAAWLAKAKKEVEADVAILAQKRVIGGVEFLVDKPVSVEPGSDLDKKLASLCKSSDWFKAIEEKAKKE